MGGKSRCWKNATLGKGQWWGDWNFSHSSRNLIMVPPNRYWSTRGMVGRLLLKYRFDKRLIIHRVLFLLTNIWTPNYTGHLENLYSDSRRNDCSKLLASIWSDLGLWSLEVLSSHLNSLSFRSPWHFHRPSISYSIAKISTKTREIITRSKFHSVGTVS